MKLNQFDDRIVLFGMSCSGKTTLAKTIYTHEYYCFDSLFQWHCIETFGLSITENFKYIQNQCVADKFVLDGWHLADSKGEYLPEGVVVYVVWAPYDHIVSQYRVKVYEHEEHRSMYKKWYLDIDYNRFSGIRYFSNLGKFEEISQNDFITFSRHNQ